MKRVHRHNKLSALALILALFAPTASEAQRRTRPGFRLLGEYKNSRQIMLKYVLVAKGLPQKKLIALATKLHRAEPKVYFWFLDDDAMFSQFLQSLKDIEAGNTDTYPADWAKEHIVVNLQEWIASGRGKYWVLCKGDGVDKIAEIK